MPLFYKVIISFWQGSNKLIEEVDDIIHHVMTNDRTLRINFAPFDNKLDNVGEAHLTHQHLGLMVNLLLLCLWLDEQRI